MTIISCSLCIISIFISTTITGIFLNIKNQRNIKKYKNNCLNHEKNLCITLQKLKNESILRQDIEQKFQNELQTVYKLHGKSSALEERLKSLECYRQKYEQVTHELSIQLNLNHDYVIKLKELKTRLEEHTSNSEKKQKILADNENKLMIQFENLANRIFSHNETKINEQNKSSLNKILYPLQEQLDKFKKQIQENLYKEEQMQNTLAYEIRNLHQLNTTITQETINLTQALKGNNKTQGNWGEVILTRTLETCGMREGHEFHLQVSVNQIDGRKLQPDVIVHLPLNKNIIIDSKVSLLAYERYFNSNNEQDKRTAITDHINSIRTHIKSLSKKNYQKLFELSTLDYILMFIPIESAFTLAINTESSLLTNAMKHNIMLVSPTTLLVALRTINNLWRYERQNHHAKKIADKAGRLYDKLKLFMDDLNKIGQYLNKAEIIYNSAKNKFCEGKGNIISQAESFRTLGVQVKQPIISDPIKSYSTCLVNEKNDDSHYYNTEDNVIKTICNKS